MTTRKYILYAVGSIAIVAIALIVFGKPMPKEGATTVVVNDPIPTTSAPRETTKPVLETPTKLPPTDPGRSTVPLSYTMAQVQAHNSQSACWTTINGNVYDLTSWISEHPGGSQAIMRLCGTDGTTAFNEQHGGQGQPEQELATFRIGLFKKK